MRGIAKAINAEAARTACFPIRSIADQAGAKKRRGFGVIVAIRQMKTKSRIGDGELGVTAVDRVAGETRVVAEILPTRSAIGTFVIGPTEPRDSNAIADLEFRICSFTDLLHVSDDLMPGN